MLQEGLILADADLYLNLVILIVLLLCSAFFSSSETALMAMNIAKIRQLEESESKKDIERLMDILKNKLNDFLITILLGNNIVNIAATAITTQLVGRLVGGGQGVLLATFIMTTLILIFGEISPKSYAAQNAEKVALKTSVILQFLQVMFKPLLWLFTTISNLVIRIAGGEMRGVTAVVTEEEIMSLVDVGEEEGVVKHQEREMIEGVFEIDEAEVSDIMIPRIDMVAIEDDTSVEEVIALVMEKGHSRIPVYRESIDNIIGIVYAKDLLKIAADAKRDLKAAKLNELLREAYYIPEGKKLSKLLKELQLKKVHMAIVLDEYGGTEGLVTIEDILEEIVGEIFDEYDSEEKKIEQIADNKYIITGDMDLEEVEDAFDVKFSDEDKEDYDSVGGYIFNTLDRVPKNGDKVEHEGLIFIVKKVMKRRVKEVFVEILEKFEEEIEE